ncbi:MAG TPA: site-2 protease family protein [Kofleriaceae bacterium]|jgi:Zn-dependent protease
MSEGVEIHEPVAAPEVTTPVEPEYAPAIDRLLNPPRVQQSNQFLLISMAIFAGTWMLRGESSLLNLGILVGVLFFHELGHAAAMLACGYRDVRVFFVPLLGAATQGRARGVARWKQALVLLAGPLPGIIVGAVLAFEHVAPARMLIMMLLGINAFNLLPLEPLDGGRLFQVLLFSRNRYLELVFRAVTVCTLVVLAIKWQLWLLAVFGGFILLSLGSRKRVLDAAQPLKHTGLSTDPHALTDEQRRTLYTVARSLKPAKLAAKFNVTFIAAKMDQLLEVAATEPARIGETLAMLLLWLAGGALTLVASFQLRTGRTDMTAEWRTYERDGYSIDLPHAPHDRKSAAGPWLVVETRRAEYGVATAINPEANTIDAQEWADSCRLSAVAHHQVLRDYGVVPYEHRFDIRSEKGRTLAIRCVGTAHKGYMIHAEPGDTDDARRVLDSFVAH